MIFAILAGGTLICAIIATFMWKCPHCKKDLVKLRILSIVCIVG
jgi:hypothetical protein